MEGERLLRNVILDAGETEILWVCETLRKRKTVKSHSPSSELKCDLKASKAHCSAEIFSSLQILSTLRFHLLLHLTACTCLLHDFLSPLFPCFPFFHLPLVYLTRVFQTPHLTCLRIPLQWKKEMQKNFSHKISFPQRLEIQNFTSFLYEQPLQHRVVILCCHSFFVRDLQTQDLAPFLSDLPLKKQANCSAMLPSTTWRQLFLASIQLILSS